MRHVAALLAVLAGVAVLAPSRTAPAGLGEPSPRDVFAATVELDVERARALLARTKSESPALTLERARLSLYVGDCDTAGALLDSLSGVKEAAVLQELAHRCSRATAGALVVEDRERGLFIRLQDQEDRALVPLLSEVAVQARAAIERDLGVVLPRPLRIDLVRDLFSLSAVSGLPLEAAETTGTVAVARWGRVNLISPRAAPHGFPWEDTLAHEITHLAISRATRDHAPLWLQEGLAKRQETRWRSVRPFDGDPPADAIAREARATGQSVGVDGLGQSIAMLPDADAASIAFAEVASFVQFWLARQGRPALRLLFEDLKGLEEPTADPALESVSGYDLAGWIEQWQAFLDGLPPSADAPDPPDDAAAHLGELVGERSPADGRRRSQSVRTSDLLYARGAPAAAADRLRGAVRADARDPSLRWRFARALIADGKADEAAPLFASRDDLSFPHAGWFALEGRHRRKTDAPGVEDSFGLALALDPYLEEAACEGEFRVPGGPGQGHFSNAPAPSAPSPRVLCEAARKIPRE